MSKFADLVQGQLPLVDRPGFGVQVDDTASNTVLNSQPARAKDSSLEIHADYITLEILTPELGQPQAILDLVSQVFRDSFVIQPGPHRPSGHNTTYDFAATSVKGIRAWWHNPGRGKKNRGGISTLRLQIGGKAIGSIPQVDLRDLLQIVVAENQAIFKRFDIAADDYTKNLWSWDDLHSAAQNKNFSGPRKRRVIDDFEGGKTYYFGDRTSSSMVRFYNKAAESGGEVDCHRMEVEFKRELAHEAGMRWLSPPADQDDSATQILADMLVGAMDFIDRSTGDKNLDRCERLAWWQNILDRVGDGVKLPRPKPVQTIEKTMRWVETKVMPSIVMLNRALGLSDFSTWLDSAEAYGREHQNDRHHKMVEAAHLEGYAMA